MSKKKTIYFDRTVPFYITDVPSFDGTPVDVPVRTLQFAKELRALVDMTERRIVESAGPEDANQDLAEFVSRTLDDIFKKGKSSGSK